MRGISFSPTTPHPITKETLPITLGHEFSGTIVELGAAVTDRRVGQRVAVQPSLACGACGACTDLKAPNVCPAGGFVGLSGGGGGLSAAVAVSAAAALPLPAHVALDVGALVEPLAVAWHAVEAARLDTLAPAPRAPTCLVIGGGPIGLAVVQVLRARGAALVLCAEVAARRQEFAREFGAHHVLDPSKEDIAARCRELCGGGQGPDAVFDCAGVPQSVETALKAVRTRGAVVNVAIWGKAVPFNPNWLVFREATYTGVLGYTRRDFEAVIGAMEDGRLKPEKMITSRIRMDRLVDDGYWALVKEKDKHVKILIDIQASL